MWLCHQEKLPDGEYKDIAHPITPELRKEITDSVIARYNEMDLEEEAVEAVERIVKLNNLGINSLKP